ncbi:MAG: glycosyltransferase family 1 protein [Cyanobacteria bacterium P01_A01_bin.84]
MRVAIIRRLPKASFSMDVYADGLIGGLKAVRPDWDIIELTPQSYPLKNKSSLFKGLHKYYERYWYYPITLKQQQADIYHIIDHSDGHIAYWLKNTGKPITVTCHDLINFIQPENIQDGSSLSFVSTATWKFAVKAIRQANHIFTVSAHTAKDVQEILKVNAKLLTVASNAVDTSFCQLSQTEIQSFRHDYHISPETTCLLNVGSNQPRKNIFTILKVLVKLAEQGEEVHLFKTGADLTNEQKIFIQTHNLTKYITYLGKPDKATLVKIYNAADILISPSLYEGFGITVLEAMACGTPVITSNSTSLPEVAGDAAILVEPRNTEAIIQAVLRLQEESALREELIVKGLSRVKLFTWEQTAEKVADVYETLVGKSCAKASNFSQTQYSH